MKKWMIIFTSIVLISIVSYGALERNQKNKTILLQGEFEMVGLQFINDYVKNCNDGNPIELLDWLDSNMLVTAKFKSELKRIIDDAYQVDSEIGLGFDPIFNAQDYPDEGFEVDSFDKKSGYLIVKGKKWTDFKLTMKLVNQQNHYLVDGCGVINIPKEKVIGN